MPIANLNILGKNEAAISMILDNLESNCNFQLINILNKLNSEFTLEYKNKNFKISQTVTADAYVASDSEFIIGATNPIIKHSTFNEYKDEIELSRYANIIHKSSEISTTASLGRGVLINSLVSIAAHTIIANFVTINRNASVGHHSIIGDFVTLNPNAVIAGRVSIGENTIIGMGAIVFDGIRIGSDCIIGAGSVVTKDVPSGMMGYGNPFRIRKQ